MCLWRVYDRCLVIFVYECGVFACVCVLFGGVGFCVCVCGFCV